MNRTVLAVAILITIAASVLFLLRYHMQVVEAQGVPNAYVLDRWTGDVYYINPWGKFLIERKAQGETPKGGGKP